MSNYYRVYRGGPQGTEHRFYEVVENAYYSHAHGDLFHDGQQWWLYWNGDCNPGAGEEYAQNIPGTMTGEGSVVQGLYVDQGFDAIESTGKSSTTVEASARSHSPRGGDLKIEHNGKTYILNPVTSGRLACWEDMHGLARLSLTPTLDWVVTLVVPPYGSGGKRKFFMASMRRKDTWLGTYVDKDPNPSVTIKVSRA